ncbi:MAG: hypothetical protein IKR34_05190 [Candidatus Gastranaerophilales bacterium]|nr:hypothetical protein [Candidatus Gastranaerophilales bacterium]
MNLKSLLKNQTVRIDNHHSDGITPLEWNKALHLHKVMNGKRKYAEVLFYITDENREPEFRKCKTKDGEIIINEIKRVLKNQRIITEFIQGFYKVLDKLELKEDIHNQDEKRRKLFNASKRILELFGFETVDLHFLDKELNIFYDRKKQIYIQANQQTQFTIGDDEKEVRNFEKNKDE